MRAMLDRMGRCGRTRNRYAGSSLPAVDPGDRRLLTICHGYWGIAVLRTASIGCRDVTFYEDRSQIKFEAVPQEIQALRNLVISSTRRSGHTNVAPALRRDKAFLMEAFPMIYLTDPAKE